MKTFATGNRSHEGWFSRNKTVLLLLTVLAIVVGCLVYFGFSRKTESRDSGDSKLVPGYNSSMLKGEVESFLPLSPGIERSKTRLYAQSADTAGSYKECIDHCLKSTKCVAITYCVVCKYHQTCFQFSTKKEIFAKTSDGWTSMFFVGKMTSPLVLKNTEVVGTERGFEREEDENADASKCKDLCEKDPHCAVYSPCDSTDVEQKCKLFSFENVLGFKKNGGTKSVIVAKYRN